MRLLKPIRIAFGVYQIWGVAAKVTAIVDGDNVILIDAGGIGSHTLISRGLRELGFSMEQVSLVVLTHYHPDHTGGLGKLVQLSSAKVAAHRSETDMLNRFVPFLNPFKNSAISKITNPFIGPLYGKPVSVDYPLDDFDALPVSDDIRVIHAPGHTQGSICVYIESKKIIVVGDALQYRFRKLSLPAAPVTQDMEQALESARKLLDVEFDTIVFSHFPVLRNNAKETLRRLVETANENV